MNLKEWLNFAKNNAVDINEHLDVLITYGNLCNSITEFGVRFADGSTIAFLNTNKNIPVVSYDIKIIKDNYINQLLEQSKLENKSWKFKIANVLNIEIEETDLLFIDTLHCYNQLKQELSLHSCNVRKFIIMHDTATFGHQDETGAGKGLIPAIEEFLSNNENWQLEHHTNSCNGLTVLKNKNNCN